MLVKLLPIVLLAVAPALAGAIELEPGQWRVNETGTDGGKPMSEVSTICLTAEQAKDPASVFLPKADTKGECKTYEIKTTPAGMSVRVDCGNPRQLAMNVNATFTFSTPRSFSAALQGTVTLMGSSTALERKLEATWLEATCRK
jgi:hypothetical protein